VCYESGEERKLEKNLLWEKLNNLSNDSQLTKVEIGYEELFSNELP